MSRRFLVLLFLLFPPIFAMAFPSPALGQPLAGLEYTITPVFPSAVAVGQSDVPASLVLESSSLVPVVVTEITLDPVCDNPTRPGGCDADGSVVLSSTAKGTGPGCEGFTFDVSGPDVTGRYLFRPKFISSFIIVLAPGLRPSCTIDFTFSVINGVPGGQIGQLATLTGFFLTPIIFPSAIGTSTMTITAAVPAVRTTVNPSSVSLGDAIQQKASVTAVGVGPSTHGPTGSMTFRLFGPDDPSCSRAFVFTSEERQLVGGEASSLPYRPSRPGTYRSVATYSGDAHYAGTSSPCSDPASVASRVSAAPTASTPPVIAGTTPPSVATEEPVPTPASQPRQPVVPPPPSGKAFPAYHPLAHADELVNQQAAAFVLLSVLAAAGVAGSARAGRTGRASDASKGSGSGSGEAEEVSSVHLDVVEVGAVTTATQALKRGDRSRTWRWPGTHALDHASLTLPQRVAPASPILARVLNDSGYLRAILGFVAVVIPFVAVALGVLAVRDVHGEALPPSFGLLVALIVLGVFDASAGFLAVATFVTGVVVLGGLSSSEDARTLLALALMWFAVPLIAGATRPLRREPTRTLEEHWERLADIVIASLIGAWAVQQLLQGLPALSGLELPIAARANAAALVVLVAIAVRMMMETIAAHWYPNRLSEVQAPELPGSKRGQRFAAKMLTLAIFLFFAVSYLGSCWQLYVGGILFIAPQVLGLFSDRFPNSPKLHTALPHGIPQLVLLLFVTAFLGALVSDLFHDNQELIRYSFLLLSLPGFVLSVLDLFGREGPEYPLRWRHHILGALVLAIGVLFVLGVIGT